LGAGTWYSYDGGPSGVAGQVRLVQPGADLTAAANQAKASPGTPWMTSNEPNVPGQDNITPQLYSDFLKQASTAIKGADPTAVLVGPNVLNWDVTCTGCAGYPSGHSWSDQFLADYRSRYGALPLNVWGMHAYSLDYEHLPLTDAGTDQAQLVGARTWLDANGLS